jgi:hypothetical protein
VIFAGRLKLVFQAEIEHAPIRAESLAIAFYDAALAYASGAEATFEQFAFVKISFAFQTSHLRLGDNGCVHNTERYF